MGAVSVMEEDIRFRSKLELNIYRKLRKEGFNPEYEQKTFVLWEGFKPARIFYDKNMKRDSGKIRDITYTPDFTLVYNGYTVFIEAKGYENDIYPIKKKLFRALMEKMPEKTIFFEVRNLKGLECAMKTIKEL